MFARFLHVLRPHPAAQEADASGGRVSFLHLGLRHPGSSVRLLRLAPTQRRVRLAVSYRAGMLSIEIRVLDPELALPSYARPGDGGADLVARHDVLIAAAGGRAVVDTGMAVAIPDGYAGFVLPRSGLAVRHGVTCVNSPGLVDAGYRGELKVALINTDPSEDYQIHRGDRIAQLVIQRVEQARFVPVDALGDSERGEGGFGHSGR